MASEAAELVTATAPAPASPRPGGGWRRLRGWALLVLIVGGGYLVLKKYVLVAKPVKVKVHVVARGIVERIVSNTKAGSIRTRRIAQLSADSPGRMVGLFKREGQRVASGEKLVALDDDLARARQSVARIALQTAQANLAQARIKLLDAARELARIVPLHRKGTVSRADVDRATTRRDLASSELDSARVQVQQYAAQLKQIQVEMDKLVVKAPFEGVIARRFCEVGEWVVPGKAVLELLDPSRLYVRAELDEVDVAKVQRGLVVRVQLDPFREKRFPGRIVRVAPRVSEQEEQNRTVEIEVEFAEEVDLAPFKVGMSADVEVIIEQTSPEVLRIPTLAIMEGNRVLVVRGDIAREVRIRPGLRNWKFTEVRGGLKAGDRVIVSLDREEVKDGAQVRVAPARGQ